MHIWKPSLPPRTKRDCRRPSRVLLRDITEVWAKVQLPRLLPVSGVNGVIGDERERVLACRERDAVLIVLAEVEVAAEPGLNARVGANNFNEPTGRRAT